MALAEVRPKAVVQRKAHVGRRGHHDVGHDPALQAAHAVGQHHLGHRPQRLEAAGQHIQRRRRLLVGGKTHETPTGKRHNGTKDVQAGLGAPVDDEHLAGRPHARAPATVVARAPVPLGCGHQAPEVAGRAYVTASPGFWQQAFGRYAARGPGDPGGHHVGHDIEVVPAGGPRAVLGGAEHRPSHCLVVDAADGGGSPETAQVVIGSDDVHAFPLSLQWSVLRVVGAGWVPTPWPPGGQRLVDPQRGVGTSTWPRAGTSSWPHVGIFSWPWTGAVALVVRPSGAAPGSKSAGGGHRRGRRRCRGWFQRPLGCVLPAAGVAKPARCCDGEGSGGIWRLGPKWGVVLGPFPGL